MLLNNQEFVEALTIKERIELFKEMEEDYFNYDQEIIDSIFMEWINRKSSLKMEDFDEIITNQGYDYRYYKYVISQKYNYLLATSLNNKIWYKNINTIIDSHYSSHAASEEIGYYLIYNPFLEKAKDELYEYLQKSNEKLEIFNSKTLLKEFYEHIAQLMFNISNKAIITELHEQKSQGFLKGRNEKEELKYFLTNISQKDNIIKFFNKYSVLCRKLYQVYKTQVDYMIALLQNIINDWSDIIEVFGLKNEKLMSIHFGQGDTHQDGKTVAILHFGDSNKIVYKPKNLHIAKLYNTLVNFLNKENQFLDLKYANILMKENYSYEEFITNSDAKSLKEVNNYYYRYGQIMGICYLLNASDIHFENIISSRDMPHVIDLETLFFNVIPRVGMSDDVQLKAQEIILNNIDNTLLIPIELQLDSRGSKVDFSGLSYETQEISKKRYVLNNIDNSNVKYVESNIVIPQSKNVVRHQNEIIDYKDFIENIIEGFKCTCAIVMKKKDCIIKIIDDYKNQIIRVIPRSTDKYVQFLQYTYHPSALKSYLNLESILENLYALPFKERKIIKSEYYDLLNGDVPVFFSRIDSKDIIDSKGRFINNVYFRSNYSLVHDKINSLDNSICANQIAIVQSSINTLPDNDIDGFFIKDEKVNDKEILEIIEVTLESILGKGIIYKDLITWIDMLQDGSGNKKPKILNTNLYDGISGISLVLVYIKKIYPEKFDRYMELTLNNSINRPNVDYSAISAYNGFASNIYPILKHMDGSFRGKRYKRVLTQFINSLESFEEKDINNYDWLSGIGSLPSLINHIYNMLPDGHLLNILNKFADILIRQKTEVFAIDNLGLAHGLSGYLLSLKNVNLNIEREDVQNLILEIEEKLIKSYDSNLSGWKFKRNKEMICTNYWCTGSIGIALSLSHLVSKKNEEKINEIQKDLEEYYIDTNKLLRSDTLCHGNLGVIDYLIYRYNITGNEILLEKAKKIFSNIIRKQKKYGHYSLNSYGEYPSTSLFTGKLGLCYIGLRLLNPKTIDSVSILE